MCCLLTDHLWRARTVSSYPEEQDSKFKGSTVTEQTTHIIDP